MAPNLQSAWSVKQQIAKLFEESLRTTVPDEGDIEPEIAPCQNPKFGDYQCNNAMGLWSRVKGKDTQFKGPQLIGQAIMKNLPPSEMIESCTIAGPGFVNIILSKHWIAKSIQKMLVHTIETWAPEIPVKRAVVDFSSPNIAKEMHVGNLRSTIIGDTLARMLEFSKVEVLRRNHVGDWGTQFGMLIEYLFEKFPSGEVSGDQAIGDLQAFYKASKQRFDSDPAFKERAQRAVVSLQGGEEKYRKAWAEICEISRRGYESVYQRLGVQLEEKGESFYNPHIPRVMELLNEKGLIEESDGAHVIVIEGKKIPLIVVKKDGGYNYASTDLAALWLPNKLVGCQLKKISTLQLSMLVLGEDGKQFRTRSTETVKLVDLLDEAKNRCRETLVQRGKSEEWTAEELDKTAEAVGYGAVQYADLKNNRATNYTFSFDQMLNDKGNTAVYLLYAHARICSIIRISGKDIEELKKIGTVELGHPDERALGLHLLQFPEIVEEACTNLLPNILCEYLYNLSEDSTGFCTNCKVVRSAEETSRLLLCEATAVVMRKCFYLLGITPLYKI